MGMKAYLREVTSNREVELLDVLQKVSKKLKSHMKYEERI